MTKHDQQQRREALIRDIRRVAQEIGYRGAGDTPRLALELDRHGIEPMQAHQPRWNGYWHGKWYGQGTSTPGIKLKSFIKRWLPDLWPQKRSRWADGPVISPCLCSKCRSVDCPREQVPAAMPKPELLPTLPKDPLPKTEVLPKPESAERINIQGWAVQQEKGYFRAHRRINGKVRSCYLGKTLDGAEEKLAAADAKFRNQWPAVTGHEQRRHHEEEAKRDENWAGSHR